MGCGSGCYGLIFKTLAKDNFGNYSGIDIYKNKKYPKEFTHHLDDAKNAANYISNETNFIVSQSALEHIEKDIETLISVTKKLVQSNKKFIQIHMIPAAPLLYLYLWHGWRQYSLRNIFEISKQLIYLDKQIKIDVFPLTGYNSFFAHLRHITLPIVFNHIAKIFKLTKETLVWSDKKGVKELMWKAVFKDLNSNSSTLNVFWVLVITPVDVDIGLDELEDKIDKK